MNTSKSEMYESVPFFDQLERNKYTKFVRGTELQQLGKLVLSISDTHMIGDLVEKISAAYLITNLMLMSKASRRIAKCIVLEHTLDGREQLFPIVNNFRYYTCGEYSRLDNFQHWVSAISEDAQMSPRLILKLGDISKFLASSEVSSRNLGQREAETMLSARSPESEEGQGLFVDTSNPFFVSFTAENASDLEVVSQSLYRKHFSLRASNSKDVIVLNLDGNHAKEAVEEWLSCLDSLLENNLLGLSI